MQDTRVCLSMIVKDEAHVIARCLRSVRSIISTWVIVDTGSTDDTERVARDALEGIPGEYVHRPWVDFATNRNEALEMSRTRGDYSFIIDADDELDLPPGYMLPQLYLDEYCLLCVGSGGPPFERTHFVSSSVPYRYLGAVHEVIRGPQGATQGTLQNAIYRIHLNEGGRSHAAGNKYLRDIEMLEAALRRDPENAKDTYFLAQSYAAAGQPKLALQTYERAANMSDQSALMRYTALLRAADLRLKLGGGVPDVVAAYFRAHSVMPRRRDVLYKLATYFRNRDEMGLAHVFAAAAMSLPPLTGSEAFMSDPSMDEGGIAEEYGIACWHLGLAQESDRIGRTLVDRVGTSPFDRANARARLGLPPEDVRWEPCRTVEYQGQAAIACSRIPESVLQARDDS
jgi:tetratricopeptide (TPR) repeat protein